MSLGSCQRCGGFADVETIEISSLGDATTRYIDGVSRCWDIQCGNVCPICRRPPGDIHSGACGPVIVHKNIGEDATRVTASDCRMVVPR